jgi:hypothetical protein
MRRGHPRARKMTSMVVSQCDERTLGVARRSFRGCAIPRSSPNSATRRRPARAGDRPRVRGPRPDGRRPHRPGHLRTPLRRPQDDRDAQPAHLRQARSPTTPSHNPARPRRAHLPALLTAQRTCSLRCETTRDPRQGALGAATRRRCRSRSPSTRINAPVDGAPPRRDPRVATGRFRRQHRVNETVRNIAFRTGCERPYRP